MSNCEVSRHGEKNSIPRQLPDHLQPLLRSALSLALASATVSHSILEMSSEAPPQMSAFLYATTYPGLPFR